MKKYLLRITNSKGDFVVDTPIRCRPDLLTTKRQAIMSQYPQGYRSKLYREVEK